MSIRHIETEGVAHVAALSASLGQGTRTAGHFDPFYGWSMEQLLQARLLDEFRMFEYGMGGKKGKKPERITPEPKKSKRTKTGEKHVGVAVPISVIVERFNLEGGDKHG